jgi:hypothetical protein
MNWYRNEPLAAHLKAVLGGVPQKIAQERASEVHAPDAIEKLTRKHTIARLSLPESWKKPDIHEPGGKVSVSVSVELGGPAHLLEYRTSGDLIDWDVARLDSSELRAYRSFEADVESDVVRSWVTRFRVGLKQQIEEANAQIDGHNAEVAKLVREGVTQRQSSESRAQRLRDELGDL